MENSKSILRIMLGDHASIEVLLDDFKKDLAENVESAKKSFGEFRWDEENVLYPQLDNQLDSKEKEMIIERVEEIPIKKGEDTQ